MAFQSHNYTKMESINEYQYDGQGCPPNLIYQERKSQLQSDRFQNDPLSGFNSMSSSYSSESSPTGNSGSNAFENLDNLISVGNDKGYFHSNDHLQKPAQHQYTENSVYYAENRINVQRNENFGTEHYGTYYNSDTVILEPVNDQFSTNCIMYEQGSDGARSYSSDNTFNGRSSPEFNFNGYDRPVEDKRPRGSVRIVKTVPVTEHRIEARSESRMEVRIEPPKTEFQSQMSQDIGDILENVDEYIKENSPSTTPLQVSSPEPMLPPPTKRKRTKDQDSIDVYDEETPGIDRKDRRKATNRKASANYRQKQVSRQNVKEVQKSEQESIRKELELDCHATKMQIEYMMKTFSQRIKTTQPNI